MRLWHEKLIPLLPRQQLLGQHRECCALRGKGWGRRHATVDYVFRYPFEYLVAYHGVVMDEMERRGFRINPDWKVYGYRGRQLPPEALNPLGWPESHPIYPEHDAVYWADCCDNLARKGVALF